MKTVTTYLVNVPAEQMVMIDTAIAAWLRNHPDSCVDDALDDIFAQGAKTILMAAAFTAAQKPCAA